MASTLDTADMAVFLSDFAGTVTATTWGTTVAAIFDREYVDFEDVSGSRPYLLLKTSDVPSDAATNDLFTVDGTVYKLVDVEYAEPGMSRVILAAT